MHSPKKTNENQTKLICELTTEEEDDKKINITYRPSNKKTDNHKIKEKELSDQLNLENNMKIHLLIGDSLIKGAAKLMNEDEQHKPTLNSALVLKYKTCANFWQTKGICQKM
jgi:Tfp pilus assembly major pilin PilA